MGLTTAQIDKVTKIADKIDTAEGIPFTVSLEASTLKATGFYLIVTGIVTGLCTAFFIVIFKKAFKI